MQDTISEHAVPVDDSNDTAYVDNSVPQTTGSGNPFDDGAVDPNIAVDRASSVTNRESDFWEKPADPEKKNTQPQKKKKKLSINARIIRDAVIALAALLILAAGVIWAVFRIQVIRVEGNERVSAEEVIRLSGVKKGTIILTLQDDAIKKAVARNRYLTVSNVERQMPGTVVIHVRERTQLAYINLRGTIYVIDSRGMVLERSDNTSARPALIRVEGLNVRSCTVGKQLVVEQESQLQTYMSLALELKAMDLMDDVTEIYVSNSDDLYLATRDGFSVRLGDQNRLHAKLRSLSLTRNWLASNGYSSGTVDVSTPEEPTFIPENNVQ